LAKFAAKRRASSRDSLLVIDRRVRLVVKIENSERLPGRVADHELLRMLVDRPNVHLLDDNG
jgi:hypothetical protein